MNWFHVHGRMVEDRAALAATRCEASFASITRPAHAAYGRSGRGGKLALRNLERTREKGHMGLFRKVTAAATGLWGRPPSQSPGDASSPRPRTPAAETPLPLRARHSAAGAGAATTPEPSLPQASLPEDRESKGLQAMDQRRRATLDELRQVSAEWAQVEQARAAAAQPRRRPTLAQLFKEQDARDAAEEAAAAGTLPRAQAGAPQAEPTPRLARSPAQRHGDSGPMALAAALSVPGPQAPPARKTVRFATQAEVRATGADGSLAGQGRTVDLDPATGRLMDKKPVRAPVPRAAPPRLAAPPGHSEPGPSTATADAGTATTPRSQPLSAAERRWLAQALPGEGRALRRLASRAARADLAVGTGLRASVTRLVGPGAPRPLDGQRLLDFRDLLEDDVAALAKHARLDVPSASSLLLRAVESGAMGNGLRLDDHLLLLGILGLWAPQEPAAKVPWAQENEAGKAPMADWWQDLPAAHKAAIEQAFEDTKDYVGTGLMDTAAAGDAPSMQALHDHLFEHYRFENGGRLHRVKPTDTGRARNHLGVIVQEVQPPAGEASAEDLHHAALQAALENIYAANDLAKRKHRYLHGEPQPPGPADPPRTGP